MQTGRLGAASVVLGVAVLGLIGAVLAGVELPLVGSDRAALIALTVVGMAMCGAGPLGKIASTGRWLTPAALLGLLLGSAALLVVIAVVAGISLPLIADDRAAFVALAGIVVAKMGIGILHRFG